MGEQTQGGNLYEGATRNENKAQHTTRVCVCVCVKLTLFENVYF